MSSYTCLHAHTALGSIRDSCLRVEDYVSISKNLGLTAIAATNHGTMTDIYKMYKECKKQEMKFIAGLEAYYAEDAQDKGSNYHILLLAKNNNGYKNLCKLNTWSYTHGFFRKPRIDAKILSQFSEDIICTTACMSSLPARLLLNGQVDACNAELDMLHKMFGSDFYLEVHDHGITENGVDPEQIIRDHYRNYGREKGIKVVPGTDVHFGRAEDKTFHNIFKQISYNSVGRGDDDGFSGSGYHIHSLAEMQAKFLQEEIDNTNEIAEKCSLDFKFTGYHLPKFDIPSRDKDAYEYLKDMCWAELKNKGLDKDQKYVDRLNYELRMLHLADLENYLLIVADYCQYCKNNGIPVGPGRGSMGGSIVSWLTNITEVDPLKYDLLFGRAINPGRSLQYDFGV